MNEKDLILKLRTGSVSAYKELYERWISRLYAFIYHYVKSEAVTDDIIQETFIRIWVNHESLNPDCSFKSYLFTISYHLLLKELRRQLKNPLLEEYIEYQDQISTSVDGIEDDFDLERFRMLLIQAKNKLSPRQREIFELNKEQIVSVSDIAIQLSISEQVVRNQLSAALKIIRSELKNYTLLLAIFLLNF